MAAFRNMLISALVAVSTLGPRGVAGLTLRQASEPSLPTGVAAAYWSSRPTPQSEHSVLLDFDLANLTHSNLGGIGPDSGEESMVIAPVGIYGGVELGVKFQVVPGSNYSGKPENNQVTDGIAKINMLAGMETQFIVTIFDTTSGEPVVLPEFFITVLDVDAGSVQGTGAHPHKMGGVEVVEFHSVDAYYMMDNAAIKIKKNETHDVAFIANLTGTSGDNPTSPYNLSEDQLMKAAMVEYKNTSRFRLTMTVQEQDGDAGRNFMIAGISDLSEAPFSFCADAAYLDMGKSSLDLNNLEGQLPGLAQMRYTKAGVVNKNFVDLWVGVTTGNYTAPSPLKNGLKGSLGQINMDVNSTVTFSFTLVSSATQTPVEVSNFFFSFYDIDQEAHGMESLTVESGRGIYFLSKNTTLQTTSNGDGSVTFTSSHFGDYGNNPRKPTKANDDEAVTLFFSEAVSTFRVTYKTVSMAGRNFLFGGMIDAACL